MGCVAPNSGCTVTVMVMWLYVVTCLSIVWSDHTVVQYRSNSHDVHVPLALVYIVQSCVVVPVGQEVPSLACDPTSFYNLVFGSQVPFPVFTCHAHLVSSDLGMGVVPFLCLTSGAICWVLAQAVSRVQVWFIILLQVGESVSYLNIIVISHNNLLNVF